MFLFQFQIELTTALPVSLVRVTTRTASDCCVARYNHVQVRVGNTDATVAGSLNYDAVMTINSACGGPRTFLTDGFYIFNHRCEPGPISGKYVTLQLTDNSEMSSFDIGEAEVFVSAKVKG